MHWRFIISACAIITLYLNLLFNLVHRKCDLPDCTNNSPIWKVFYGCGHSFHVQCILPEISTCPLCQSTLLAQIESLGQTANNAVSSSINIGNAADEGDDQRDDEYEESDDDEPIEEQGQEETEVSDLLEIISNWRRSEMPQPQTR